MTRIRLFVLSLLALTFMACSIAQADERILSFDSDLRVESDGAFMVTETIRVRAEGDRIQRGIFRDFPMLAKDAHGTYRVGFELVSAKRDGQPEPSRIDQTAKAIRIYLGDSQTSLTDGEHVYQLTYRSDRQLRFFDGHDEVYWNVTGTEWLFPIDKATATVTLPEGAKILQMDAFTGAYGSTEKAAQFSQDGRGRALFQTSAPLAPQQGMTVAVSFAKGAVAAPTPEQRKAWFQRDHRADFSAFGGLGAILLYYLAAWWFFGRDPKIGVVVPRWLPPSGMSAAMVGASWDNAQPDDDKILSLSLVELASRGVIRITMQARKSTLLTLRDAALPSELPPEQRLIVQALKKQDGTLKISRANGGVIQSLRHDGAASIRSQRKLARIHRPYGLRAALGLLLSLPLLIWPAIQLLEPLNVMTILFVIAAVFLLSMLRGVAVAWGKGKGVFTWFSLLLGVAIMGAGTALLLYGIRVNGGGWSMPAALAGIVLVNLVFVPILGGPTMQGQSVLDEIRGLREYIQVAEKDRLAMADAPTMSVAHFEQILPFAMALGLEQVWSERLRAWLECAGQADEQTLAAGAHVLDDASMIRLYIRNRTSTQSSSGGGVMERLSNSLTAALPVATSSSSAFGGSSSGGGSSSSSGGSSGGGGGGGGGGGW